MDGANSLGEPVRISVDVAAIRRNIAVAVGLMLVFAFVMWLAPEKDAGRTVFEAGRSRPQAPATQTANEPQKTSPRDERVAGQRSSTSTPASHSMASRGETAAGASTEQEPLERLPPRPPLSDEALRADTPRPKLLPRPVALDGAHIAYRQGVITLPGVEAVPLAEQCGSGAAAFPCGVMARTELRRFLRGRSIACEVPDDFGVRRGEATTACTVADEDIGRWVVENGWARATPDGPYVEVEAAARKAQRGIWR
ncbi:thermonuclease family protein [Jiella mangrovi]|uniref:Thermonuclease family protein n=1 Tax=Jiella mangrovi TaxID=2821407 RepID=A0ABS4BCX7_9HYPH|nr:thermonuclease family protein [Jiella mangrovi]MBP0614612.1 hypothetical protein [Jiella mangrovi]